MAGYGANDEAVNSTPTGGYGPNDTPVDTTPPKPSGIVRRAADYGISALKSAISVPETAVGLADIVTGGQAGKVAEAAGFRPKEAKAMLDEYLSPEQKAANLEVQQAEGFLPTIGAALKHPSTIAHTIVESAAPMLAGGVVARGIGAVAPKIAPVIAGAIGEGVVGAGSAAEQVRQQTADGTLGIGQIAPVIASGIGTAAFGAAGGRIAQKLGISDVDTMLAQGGAGLTSKGVARRIVEGGISEGAFEELPQSVQEQIWQNVALDKPLLAGVPESAAMGLLTGGVMGGGVAGIAHKGPTAPTEAPTAATTEPLPGETPETPETPEQAFLREQGAVKAKWDEQAVAAEKKRAWDEIVAQRDATIRASMADKDVPLPPADPYPEAPEGTLKAAVNVSARTGGSFGQMSELANLAASERADKAQQVDDLLTTQAVRRESELESADARVAGAQASETRNKRLQMLDAIYADDTNKRPGMSFLSALEQEFPNAPMPTTEEKQMIAKRESARRAFRERAAPLPSAPDESGGMGVRERAAPMPAMPTSEPVAKAQRLLSDPANRISAKGDAIVVRKTGKRLMPLTEEIKNAIQKPSAAPMGAHGNRAEVARIETGGGIRQGEQGAEVAGTAGRAPAGEDQRLIPVSKRLTPTAEAPKLTVPSITKEPAMRAAPEETVSVKDIYGRTIRVRQSDLSGDAERIPAVRENGEIVSGEEVPRSILRTEAEGFTVPERFKASKSPVMVMKGSHVPGAEYTAYESGTRTHLDKNGHALQGESSGSDAVKIAMRYRTADDIAYANDAARTQLAENAEGIAAQQKAVTAEQSRREEESRRDRVNRTALSEILEKAKFTKGEFLPTDASGKPLPPISGYKYGPFLVHKSEGHFLRGQEYTVSHPATGFAVLRGFKSLASAKQAAVRLARSGPFDTMRSADDFKKDEFNEARRIGTAIKSAGADPLAAVSDEEVKAPVVQSAAPTTAPVTPPSAASAKSSAKKFANEGGNTLNDAERELRSLARDNERLGDVLLGNGKYAPFDDVVRLAREGIDSGAFRPWPAQLNFNLDISMRDVDRVLASATTVAPATPPSPATPTVTAQPDGRLAVTGLPAETVRAVRDLLGVKGAVIGANGNAIFPKGTDTKALRAALGVTETAKPPKPAAEPTAERTLSVGPKAKGGALHAEPVSVRDGMVYIGEDPATNLDGEDITVPADATNADIRKALEEGGALTTAQRVYGMHNERNGDPSPEEAQFVEKAIEGTTVLDAARFIVKSGTPDQSEIANKVLAKLVTLKAAGIDAKLRIVHRDDEQAPRAMNTSRGYTEFERNGNVTIWLHGSDMTGRVGTEYETLLHELVHAATAGTLRAAERSPEHPLRKTAYDLQKVSDVIAAHLTDRFSNHADELTEFEKDVRAGANNAFKKDYEVVAWALSNKDAQAYLDAIPYANGTLWSKFVQAVRTMLGMNPSADTALSEVLRVSERLLEPNPEVRAAPLWSTGGKEMYPQGVAGEWSSKAGNEYDFIEKHGVDANTYYGPNGERLTRTVPNVPHTVASLRSALIAAQREIKPLLDNGTVRLVSAAEASRVLGEPVTPRDKAFFNPEDGTTYFIAERIDQSAPLRGLIKHEIAVHAYQLGRNSAEFKDILRQVEAMKGPEIEAARARVPADTPIGHRAEEALAYLVENHPTLGIVKRVIAWFRNALRAIGWNAPLSVTDIRYMAERAMTNGGVVSRGGAAFRSVIRADGYNIIADPDRQQASNLIARSEAGDLRGLRDPGDGTLYVWDAYKATHQDAAETLGIDRNKAERLIFSAKELQNLPSGVFSGEPGYRRVKVELPKPAVGEAKMTHEEFQRAFFSRSEGYGAPMPSERKAAFQKLSTVGEFLGTLWNNDKSLSPWMKSVGTQYHTAATLAKQGKPEFKRVFDKGQDFLDDVSTFALKAENLAPTLFPRFKKVGDIFKRNIGASKADTQAIARPLYDGTLANKVWKNEELVSKFGLTATQIKLYREALSAINQSVFDLAKSVIVKHAKLNGIVVDREMSLSELSAHVQKALNLSKTPETAARIEKTVADVKAIESKALGLRTNGYFPLMRFGEHTVTMRDKDGEVTVFSMFESQVAANRAAEALAADNPDQTVEKGMLSKKSWKLYGGLNLDALALFAENMDKETLEPYQEYLRTAVSGNSAMKRMLQRKGTAGFSENVERTVAQMITSNARHISALYNMGDMRKAVDAVPQGDIKDHAVDLFTYLSDANEEAAALRGFLFFNYIGGSLASAMVNLTQIPMMSAPFLTQFADGARVTKALVSAARLKREHAAGDLAAAWKKADEEGITAPQEIHQLTAQASNRLGSGSHGWQRFFKAWGGMFEMAETFNRETTFVAAFNLAKENKKSAAEAYDFAKDAVEQTQGIYNKGNRPTWGRGTIGATIFTFKQFSIMYLELLQRMPPKQRMLMLGMLMLAAGGEGEPFYDDLTDMIDTVLQWLGYATNTKRAIRKGVKEALGEDIGSFALQGASSVLPIDVQGRMSMSNLLPGTSYFKQSAVDKGREALEVFGVTGSLLQNAGSAVENLAIGNAGGVIKSIAPVAVKNAYQGLEMLATGHGVDIKGRKTADVSEEEAAAKMIGFSPRPIAELGRAQRELMQDRNLQRVKEDEIVSMMVRGRLDNDPEAVAKAYSALKKWNETNPELPIRITPTQVQSRLRAARMSSEQRFIKGTSPELRGAVIRELQGG